MKKIILSCFVILCFSVNAFAIDLSLPHDAPTLEALIYLHKLMKKNEDISLTQVSAMTLEQEGTTKFSSNYSDVRQYLNTKMADTNSYLVLLNTISTVAQKLKYLSDEFSEFIKVTKNEVANKPYCINTFTNASVSLENEMGKLVNKILVYTGAGVNLLKASMDEKFRLLNQIDTSITSMRNTIRSASNYIKYTTFNDYQLDLDNLYDIDRATIANDLINQWKQSKDL